MRVFSCVYLLLYLKKSARSKRTIKTLIHKLFLSYHRPYCLSNPVRSLLRFLYCFVKSRRRNRLLTWVIDNRVELPNRVNNMPSFNGSTAQPVEPLRHPAFRLPTEACGRRWGRRMSRLRPRLRRTGKILTLGAQPRLGGAERHHHNFCSNS